MDPLTASVALVIVQFCTGLIMAGLFLNTPSERCTRIWALSGALSGLGVCVTVVSYGGSVGLPRHLGLLTGNTALFAACILAWSGLRSFYQRQAGWWPALLIVSFGLAFEVLLLLDLPFAKRSLLVVLGLQLSFLLLLMEFLLGLSGPTARRYARWGFGRVTGLLAVSLLIGAYLGRMVLSQSNPALFEPPAMSSVGVTLIYLVPLGGTLLLVVSLMMVYFERLLADKQRLATEDELTGTLNRRELVRSGEQALQQALSGGKMLTLAFIDVDHFKQINDRHGHLMGDRVLAGIGRLLRENCQEGDLLGRYGGEEFCAVFPGRGDTEASLVGQQLLESVRARSFEHGDQVTISIGLAVLKPGQVRSWDALVHAADQALYRAKSEGRNAFRLALAA
ncbi:MAG: GGDEF domain-containing protein [Herbaspirillum sp.]|nr:GGDEF domain-containing protein [Herbaspirillum sp.]